MSEGFPLLTTKKMYWKGIVTELLWFLRGDTNIKFLIDNDCHIWDGDAYKKFHQAFPETEMLSKEQFINQIKKDFKFAEKWGDLGPVYGKQWRGWKIDKEHIDGVSYFKYPHIDQIANLISDLETNPDSRRLMVSAWNVGELDQMTLPPCHYGFQIYTRELSESERFNWYGNKISSHMHHDHIVQEMDHKNVPTRAISLMWSQRSCDSFLGLPFNIASYGLLLEIIAKTVNMVPDELIGNLGDTHLYSNHIEQAKEQIGRELTLEERKGIYEKEYTEGMKIQNDEWLESKLKTRDIPTQTREPYPLPKLFINDEFWNHDYQTIDGWINSMETGDFRLENYQSHPAIKAPLNN